MKRSWESLGYGKKVVWMKRGELWERRLEGRKCWKAWFCRVKLDIKGFLVR